MQHLGTEDHESTVNRKKAMKQKTLIYWRNDEFGFRHFEFEVSTEHTKGCIYQVARKADLQTGRKAGIRNRDLRIIHKEVRP